VVYGSDGKRCNYSERIAFFTRPVSLVKAAWVSSIVGGTLAFILRVRSEKWSPLHAMVLFKLILNRLVWQPAFDLAQRQFELNY